MNKFDNNIHLSTHRSSSLSVFLVLVLSLIGFFVIGPFLGLLLAQPFYDGSFANFQADMLHPYENPGMRVPFYIVQGMATLTGMIIMPLLYLWFIEKKTFGIFFDKRISLLPMVVASLIVISFMGVNSIFIEWNASIDFPEFMQSFENWARKTEDMATRMTEYLTTFENSGQFALAFLIVAILPAVGEELLFRGILQNQFYSSTRNAHLAIWIAAILFSTIHMQFYGFIPRMLLGALFGYLYYWSGNLFIPILAHLINNGLTLILFYLYDLEVIETDVSNTEAGPLYAVFIFAIITAILIYYFRKFFLKAKTDI
ncbi:CPBP family intramembrane metalloprotease [Fulvivirga sp. RKSG066]|uniref:CPBP family intramembrane glutamic endopeptidase n=1 Tax=Fulvivirga aurantia TaxID=2529383 RepID=UPI0012BC6977|nr:CPBP family intramembrane glutamic endopeptidase [Fulvivirga aurantia]MTI22466.1 CPBP family intramembrane metalloprotease [Fulvivirga aurantia]